MRTLKKISCKVERVERKEKYLWWKKSEIPKRPVWGIFVPLVYKFFHFFPFLFLSSIIFFPFHLFDYRALFLSSSLYFITLSHFSLALFLLILFSFTSFPDSYLLHSLQLCYSFVFLWLSSPRQFAFSLIPSDSFIKYSPICRLFPLSAFFPFALLIFSTISFCLLLFRISKWTKGVVAKQTSVK